MNIPRSHLKPVRNDQQEINQNFYNKNARLWEQDLKDEKGYGQSLKIVKERLRYYKIKTILDVGTGEGTPMLQYLNMGYNVEGIDFAVKQLELAKEKLKRNSYDENLVKLQDVNNFHTNKKYDCINIIGVLPHLNQQSKVIQSLSKQLKRKGVMFASFRNPLFSLFSLNQYSYEFFTNDLIDIQALGVLKKQVDKFLKTKLSTKTTNVETGILSQFNNPLTISELFESSNMEIIKIHFFHYHAAPPIFEKMNPQLFNSISSKIENPNEWKGYFMASAYIVEARKK